MSMAMLSPSTVHAPRDYKKIRYINADKPIRATDARQTMSDALPDNFRGVADYFQASLSYD
jgi:hypothetical protein